MGSLEEDTLAAPETVFRAASIFTGVGRLGPATCLRRGELTLDAPVREYLIGGTRLSQSFTGAARVSAVCSAILLARRFPTLRISLSTTNYRHWKKRCPDEQGYR